MRNSRIILAFAIVLGVVLASIFVSAQSFQRYTSSRYVTHQYQPGFQTYYSSQFGDSGFSHLQTYWPILGDESTCDARQDLLLQIAPAGCQPAVVRSDLLAEQNIPVFCQIDALKINPLIDIKEIKNIRFKGKYPKDVIGTGFHPAKAALRTQDTLLGSPLINNIGYVVVVLKKNPVEKDLPSFVNVSLSAQLEYDSGNALGIGKAEFVLSPSNDAEWNEVRNKQSFWQGRYFVRLDNADERFATVSIYNGDKRVSTTKVEKGKLSNEIYLPGSYCRAALQVAYDSYEAAQNKARLEISDEFGTEIVEVYQGSKLMNDLCSVEKIAIDEIGLGNVTINCRGERIVLKLKAQSPVTDGKVDLSEKNYKDNPGLESYFADAIRDYEGVADDFGAERANPSEGGKVYGMEALAAAIELSRSFGKLKTEARLMNKFIELYGTDSRAETYKDKLNKAYKINYEDANGVVNAGTRYRTVSLVELDKPSKTANAKFVIGGSEFVLGIGQEKAAFDNGRVVLKYLYGDRVTIGYNCKKDDGNMSKTFKIGEADNVCGVPIKLEEIDSEKSVKIRLVPKAKGTQTETNLTVNIGIEKRAIQLSPDKTLERIKNLNESIKKWEGISKGLGNVVKGLKAACFATSAVLTVKNFITGLGGEALARDQAMRGPNGWTAKCQSAIINHNIERNGVIEGVDYRTPTECYNGEREFINSEVSARTEAIKSVNEEISKIQEQPGVKSSGLVDSSVDVTEAKRRYAKVLNEKYRMNIATDDESLKYYSLIDLREMHYNRILKEKNAGYSARANIEYESLKAKVESAGETSKLVEQAKAVGNDVSADPALVGDVSGLKIARARVGVINNNQIGGKSVGGAQLPSDANSVMFVSGRRKITGGENTPDKYESKNYLVAGQLGNDGKMQAKRVYEYETDASGNILLKEPNEKYTGKPGVENFKSDYSISDFRNRVSSRFRNPISPAYQKVHYFGYGSYEGLPAQVPFDVNNGWYTKVTPVLAVGNQIPSYDSSGMPRIFDVCNVGEDSSIDGNDECQTIHVGVNDDAPILGLDEKESRDVIRRAQTALRDAASQKGSPSININGARLESDFVPPTPTTQCQDFMSPDDCKVLFNVCDPVICPESRCNLGGTYQVANVVQTGIIGSLVLCLPNVREGVLIPVCLTGLHAGIDNFVSIMKSHRDCLQENLRSGRMIGICDQIYSIYLCEFFWRQIAPVANVILPKLVELAYSGGQGARGGGEYLTVTGAWNNMRKSVDYFTQVYAANSLQSFRTRSIAEAGGQFCKAFISMKGPKSFETLIEPDSPPQFFASFDSIRYSDATVPATAQYKVFYQIFAGKDSGVYYRVYLRNPPSSDYYVSAGTVQVASGFISKGQYASQTKDFTAPEGYKELCVAINDKEECGFKQVSTGFAVNYLRDLYAQDELNNQNIKSERECIYGSPSLGAVMANTNPQSAIEEAGLPQAYKRGVVRICSTTNPGISTDSGRFIEVGYCDDKNKKCWLDQKSVDNAITDDNIGLKNETLRELQEINKVNLANQGVIVNANDVAMLKVYEEKKERLRNSFGEGSVKSNKVEFDKSVADLLVELDEFRNNKLYLNHHKAWMLLVRAQISEIAGRALKPVEAVKVTTSSTGTSGAGTSTTTTTAGKTVERWTLESAIEEGKKRTGTYSQNEEFVDDLEDDGLLTAVEYDEIDGGILNIGQADMKYVLNILEMKKEIADAKAAGKEVIGSSYEVFGVSKEAKISILNSRYENSGILITSDKRVWIARNVWSDVELGAINAQKEIVFYPKVKAEINPIKEKYSDNVKGIDIADLDGVKIEGRVIVKKVLLRFEDIGFSASGERFVKAFVNGEREDLKISDFDYYGQKVTLTSDRKTYPVSKDDNGNVILDGYLGKAVVEAVDGRNVESGK